MCLSASQEGQDKALNSLELELLVAVNSHMDAGTEHETSAGLKSTLPQ